MFLLQLPPEPDEARAERIGRTQVEILNLLVQEFLEFKLAYLRLPYGDLHCTGRIKNPCPAEERDKGKSDTGAVL